MFVLMGANAVCVEGFRVLDVLKRMQPYSPSLWEQKCDCNDPNCQMKRYGGRYFIVQFDAGEWTYCHWFSRN
jgi:hypothetical protein